ncbi:MAG: SIMPL domain-containing protein [Planctomycetota bacterium]
MKSLLTSLFVVFTASTLAAQQPPNLDQPKITVTGEALVYAKPDKIILNFGIETRDTQLLTAKRKTADIWKKAAAALKESGVPDKDVQTDYLSIEPRYKNYNEMEGPIGYVTRNMFVVTLADPAKVEVLISQMLEVGVNHVNGVEFQTTQFKQHRESARELALKAAREKADKMAAALGCAIGKPVAINETYGGGSWYFSSWSGFGYGRSSGGMSQNVIQDQRGSGGENPESMALGKISIRAGVSVTFELKDSRSDSKKP